MSERPVSLSRPQRVLSRVYHRRDGSVSHGFTYGADYTLLDPEKASGPWLLSYDRVNLASFYTRDHGGTRHSGRGAPWAWDVLDDAGFAREPGRRLLILTQLRTLGFWFTPVSFWLAFDRDNLVAVIAEVNNTFGDRHSYLAHRPDFAPIGAKDELVARKVFHVSPFREIAGSYRFRFEIAPDRICIRIAHEGSEDRFVASMVGRPEPLRNRHLLGAVVRRPLGPVRVLALIYWNAIVLKLKGAIFRSRPEPPDQEVTT